MFPMYLGLFLAIKWRRAQGRLERLALCMPTFLRDRSDHPLGLCGVDRGAAGASAQQCEPTVSPQSQARTPAAGQSRIQKHSTDTFGGGGDHSSPNFRL